MNLSGASADIGSKLLWAAAAGGKEFGLSLKATTNGSMYIPMLMQSGGKSLGYLAPPAMEVSHVRGLNVRNADFLLDVSRASPWLQRGGTGLSLIGLVLEGFSIYKNPDPGFADYGHFGVSGGAFLYGSQGGLPGLAVASLYTVSDFAMQDYKYQLKYGTEPGKIVNSWSSLYYEGAEIHETQVIDIMSQYKISRPEAQNFWYSSHRK